MSKQQGKFARLKVSTPCSAGWNEMVGDNQMRHCSACDKSVYDFSQMTPRQIESLVAEKKGILCGRITRDLDGRMITLPEAPRHAGDFINARRSDLTLAKSVISTLLSVVVPVGSTLPVLASSIVWAQQTGQTNQQPEGEATAELTGVVVDELGAFIPTGRVVLKNQDTLLERSTNLSTYGRFQFTKLKQGSYTLSVEVNGFKRYQQLDIVMQSNQNNDLGNIVLQVGDASVLVGIIAVQDDSNVLPSDIYQRPYRWIKKLVLFLKR